MDHFEKYFNKALRFLSYRQRSEKEVRDNLQRIKSRKGRYKPEEVDIRVIDRVIAKLKEKKFINDEEFAKAWIESRMRAKPRSIRVIKMELRQKGIDEVVVDDLLQNSESPIQSDLEMAKKLAEKKTSRYSRFSPEEVRIKLGQLLARNGFDWDTVKSVVDDMVKKRV